MADVGCGFGGLLTALAPLFPDTLILGEPSSSFKYCGELTNDWRVRDGDSSASLSICHG